MRLSIATKIFVAFAAVVVIFTGVVMFGIYRTQSLYGRIQRLNHSIVPLTLMLSDVQTDLKSFNVVLNERDPLVLRRTLQVSRLLYFLPDQLTTKVRRAHAMAEDGQLDDMVPAPSDESASLAERLETMRARAAAFADQSRAFTALVLRDRPHDDPQAYATQIIDLQAQLRAEARALDEQIAALRRDLRQSTDLALQRANDAQRSSLYALMVLSGVALAIALALLAAVLLTLRRLTALTEATRRIGEGDYRPIQLDAGRLGDDEIATLTREFNSMAQSLAERDQKLRDQHAQLLRSERLATVGRMTSLITHELRNPLSSIGLNSEMLQETLLERGIDPTDPEVMPLLETIVDEVDRLRDITEEYLVYARLPQPNLEPQNLPDIVHNLVDFHHWEWAQEGVEVGLEVDEADLAVLADANQLRQALLNLLKNAVEAGPADHVVRVRVAAEADAAVVTIADDGPGMAAEVAERIFDPFFTTKSHGTGLGLAMTQQIVEEHRGDIEVDSAPGQGTTFTVRLPRHRPPS